MHLLLSSGASGPRRSSRGLPIGKNASVGRPGRSSCCEWCDLSDRIRGVQVASRTSYGSDDESKSKRE